MLKDRPDDVNAFIEDARKFATGDLSAAMSKGDKLSDSEKVDIAKKMARFTGLAEEYLVKANLSGNLFQFMKELQRCPDVTTARLTAPFSGPTANHLGRFT